MRPGQQDLLQQLSITSSFSPCFTLPVPLLLLVSCPVSSSCKHSYNAHPLWPLMHGLSTCRPVYLIFLSFCKSPFPTY
ncbi:hypothetical protein CALVIDRAFT_123228 [Calocera viscosa TUFC12733]|uniref:Uncharacterized protein n=1 Tax=Calocera viscosa (strain TUFC12733) TaxID=1330018 RepID=A0A167RNC8_CALVF|nr:hypothetical protein CALVIDRAFT_123228 [Calocera viscosa TUFC12733]